MSSFTTNIRELAPFCEKWAQIRTQLQEKLDIDTSRVPTIYLGSELIGKIAFDGMDRETTIKSAFDETIEMSDCTDAETVYMCFQRMSDLCQVLDYGPAGAWLGLFCEELLEKYTDAQYWYNKAASFGNGIGMYRVGLLYLNKKVPLPRQTSLKRCFTDALAHGVPQAKEVLDRFWGETESPKY